MVVALGGAPVFGDGTAPEQSLQSLLSEVRTLREDLRAAIVTAQRMQIVLYRLQVQETAVARATQKLEEVRGQLAQLEESKKSMVGSVQQLEEQLGGTQDPNARKMLDAQMSRFKSMLDGWGAEISKLQAKEAEALGQVQNEQARHAEYQESLDRLDKSLETLRTLR
jgi:chromosome segregation ATPase